MKKLPVDVQSITKMLTQGYTYVDKTAFAHQLITGSASNYFISRPRRFGKSLFVNTLKEIFSGNKELFKDCAIYRTDYAWPKYPVLVFDFSDISSDTPETFRKVLDAVITRMATEHGMVVDGPTPHFRLQVLIEELAKKHKQVAVLVDEYDKPILRNIEMPFLESIRVILEDFFALLKSHNEYLRFTFTTGVSRFSKVSLFTVSNNLEDITMDPDYATMLGYTEEELKNDFAHHLQAIADQRTSSLEGVFAEIKEWYNGYRFSEEEAYVYNPFSTLKYLKAKKPKSYWYTSGTPSFLIHQIQKYPATTLTFSGIKLSQNRLADVRGVEAIDLPTLMFQAGYLTIQDWEYDNILKTTIFILDFPNEEVHQAFYQSLVQDLGKFAPEEISSQAVQLRQELTTLDLAAFVQTINVQFAKIPYDAFRDAKEGFYQMILLLCLDLSGMRTYGEVHTNLGRIDLVLQQPQHTFIFELKVDQPVAVALDQIHNKRYQERYLKDGKEIVAVAISFRTESRNIGAWKGGLYTPEGQLVRELN